MGVYHPMDCHAWGHFAGCPGLLLSEAGHRRTDHENMIKSMLVSGNSLHHVTQVENGLVPFIQNTTLSSRPIQENHDSRSGRRCLAQVGATR